MSDNKDTRKKVREQMDKLSLKLLQEVSRMAGAEHISLKLDVHKTVSSYLSVANREPQEAEGGDFAHYRDQLSRGHSGGGGDTGAERDPDEGESGEPGDPDSPDSDDNARPDGTATAESILAGAK